MLKELAVEILDMLDRKPLWGSVSGFFAAAVSTKELLQVIGFVLGVLIAVITLVLRLMDLRDRIREERKPKHKRRKVSRKPRRYEGEGDVSQDQAG